MSRSKGLNILYAVALCLMLVHTSKAQNTTRQNILRRLLTGEGMVYDARVPPNFEDNYATDVSVQIYVLSFDSLTEISMVNAWWGLPSTVRAAVAGAPLHPPPSHFLHHYLHLKHYHPHHHYYHYQQQQPPPSSSSPAGTPVSGSGSGGSQQQSPLPSSARRGATYDTRLPRSHNSGGHGVSHEGHLFPKENRQKFDLDGYLALDLILEGSITQEYSLSIFLRMHWLDRRLIWNDTGIDGPLEMDPKLIDRVWSPDLYFLNEKEAIVHDVTVINRFMHIYNNGTINTSTRISMTLSCDMHLDRYPHDEQTCSIYAGSYSYSKENVDLRWHESPLQLRPALTLPRFTVKGFNTSGCDNLSFGEHSMITGNFSCIQANFYLQRQFGYYIAQVYIPSVLIVVLSWVSFWIDIDAIPARVSLGLLTVLAITTQSTGEKSALPRVSYVKALDVWMAVCLMFVFMALLEFSYVNVQCRVQKRRQETILVETTRDRGAARNGKDANDLEQPRRRSGRRFVFFRDRMKLQRARFVDKCSRVAFPALFLVFNVTYWLYYRQA